MLADRLAQFDDYVEHGRRVLGEVEHILLGGAVLVVGVVAL